MQVNSSNGSLQQRFFSGTGSIGGIHLPDFNDKYIFSKKKSGVSDKEYRKQIREQAYEDFEKGQFQNKSEGFNRLMKSYTSEVSPDRKGIITSGLKAISRNRQNVLKPIDFVATLLEGKVKYQKLPSEKLMTFTEYWDNFVKGFADMLPIIILLIAALTFQTIANQMQMTEFFIDITQPILSAKIFPMLAFIITGILAFMIANAWGVCTLVAPVLLPLGASVGANAILIMAAILSGCAFGNHACFYCDTTVLASQGSGIDNFDHAVSQLPYVLIGAGISIIGFLVLGFVM